jgi:hypothetical protein
MINVVDQKEHGVFIYYFLKITKEGRTDLAEISEYIKPQMENEAKQLNVQQNPSIRPDVEKNKGALQFEKVICL